MAKRGDTQTYRRRLYVNGKVVVGYKAAALASGISERAIKSKVADGRGMWAANADDTDEYWAKENWRCSAPSCCACEHCRGLRAQSKPRTPAERWARIRREWAGKAKQRAVYA